jgi:cellulose synthase operon protein C
MKRVTAVGFQARTQSAGREGCARFGAVWCGVLVLCLLQLACSRSAQAQAGELEPCRAFEHKGERQEARACYQKLASSGNAYTRAEAFWGLKDFQRANDEFKKAVAAEPKNPMYRVRWGRLLLERFNPGEAAKLFQEALELDPREAGAHLGMSMVAAVGFDREAVEKAEMALQMDPGLVEGHEFLARLALEESDFTRARRRADDALKRSAEALQAMAIHATADWLEDKPGEVWMQKIAAVNPVYGEGYATAGYFFVLNRRYEEGIAYYRKALELDPELWHARSELGINLMRVGLDEEAREQLERTYEGGYRNNPTVNSLRLLDSYKNFVTFRTDQTIVKLHKKEAELLRPYVEGELQKAIATYNKKYKLVLDRPVQLELYPDHEDFAVRTLGMPGLGALGVAFGYSVAMDSPSGRKPGSFHWASTLWHELSHVYVLAATKHRVPRWFTEGMAVYEETAVAPDWGDRLSPEVIAAIQKKRLLPVANLDRGFVRPDYPGQVIVSYYQAGKICEYIVHKWSYDKLLEMVKGYAGRKSTPEVIQAALGISPEELDKQFLTWIENQTRTPVEKLSDWTKRLKELNAAASAKNHDEVIRIGAEIRDWYPEYVEAGNVYSVMAEAYEAKGDSKAAMAELRRYSKVGGRDPVEIKKLADLLVKQGQKQEAAAALSRLLYIYPSDEDLHRRLGDLYSELSNQSAAIREYEAVIAMNPHDKAASHFSLARAYRSARRNDDAREHLFLALEAAPGYKPAQQMLLELERKQ